MSIVNKLTDALVAFMGRDSPEYRDNTVEYSTRPFAITPSKYMTKNVMVPIMSHIAQDAASVMLHHVEVDENGKYINDIPSALNNALQYSANIDQTSISFMYDLYYSLLDEGVIAVYPTEWEKNDQTGIREDIYSYRVAKILGWKAKTVRLEVYNEETGEKQEIWAEKKDIVILENPFFELMNAPNSTAQRLIRKIALLDKVDSENNAGRLDLIIQLPYLVKSAGRMKQAEKRRRDIEDQLTNSKYGIAYTDGTEKITQLNRPIENTLQAQIKDLTEQFYSELGMTPEILNGTANETTMANYYTRVVGILLNAVVLEYRRKFLNEEQRAKNQTIMYFMSRFNLVPIDKLAQIAQTCIMSEIMYPNEFRQILGLKPSDDPRADMLGNRNINPTEAQYPEEGIDDQTESDSQGEYERSNIELV